MLTRREPKYNLGKHDKWWRVLPGMKTPSLTQYENSVNEYVNPSVAVTIVLDLKKKGLLTADNVNTILLFEADPHHIQDTIEKLNQYNLLTPENRALVAKFAPICNECNPSKLDHKKLEKFLKEQKLVSEADINNAIKYLIKEQLLNQSNFDFIMNTSNPMVMARILGILKSAKLDSSRYWSALYQEVQKSKISLFILENALNCLKSNGFLSETSLYDLKCLPHVLRDETAAFWKTAPFIVKLEWDVLVQTGNYNKKPNSESLQPPLYPSVPRPGFFTTHSRRERMASVVEEACSKNEIPSHYHTV